MARQTKSDELNLIPIDRYFREMELSTEEIEQRISFAEELLDIFLYVFGLCDVLLALGESDISIVEDALTERYLECVENRFPDMDGDLKQEVDSYIKTISADIVATSKKNTIDDGKPYGSNYERAVSCAENESNSISNAIQMQKAIDEGYKMKTWITMNDNKVRHSHWLCDGETIGIHDEFEVGKERMLYPRQLGKSPKEVIGCRCSLMFS